MANGFITDPIHGGKITCHKCSQFICKGEDWFEFCPDHPDVFFHLDCFNAYQHHYGLDKPID